MKEPESNKSYLDELDELEQQAAGAFCLPAEKRQEPEKQGKTGGSKSAAKTKIK